MRSGASQIVDAYTRAADTFDDLPFWHHYGHRTVAAAAIAPGARVLDYCCGTGASALPAARAAGPAGRVYAVDLTPALIDIARRRAAGAGLAQVTFAVQDAAALECPPESYDVVMSAFGLFFLDDMPGMLRRAWRWLAPGGRLVSTVWGTTVLEPGERYFWDAVRAEDASLSKISPAATLATPEGLTRVHVEAGLALPTIVREAWRMPLTSPEAFWPVIQGTSNRGVFDALSVDAQARVKASTIDRLRAESVTALEMDALIAVVVK